MKNEITDIENKLSVSESIILDKYEYALYLSLGLPILCSLFFEYINETKTRNNIVKFIKAICNRDNNSISINFMEKLILEFEKSHGRERIAIGATIKELINMFPNKLIKKFFEIQILSSKVSDRKRAYEIADHIYDEKTESQMWQAWELYKDNNCIDVLSIKSNTKTLEDRFEEIWKTDRTSFYIKNNILKKIAKFNFSKLLFLKSEYPISYLSACVAANANISDQEAIGLAKKSSDIKEFGYSLWCLGALGKTKAIYKLLSEAGEIEKQMLEEFTNAQQIIQPDTQPALPIGFPSLRSGVD